MKNACKNVFLYVVYAVELKVSTVYVSEASDEATAVQVCAVVTGRYDNAVEDVIVALNFIDSQLAGIKHFIPCIMLYSCL